MSSNRFPSDQRLHNPLRSFLRSFSSYGRRRQTAIFTETHSTVPTFNSRTGQYSVDFGPPPADRQVKAEPLSTFNIVSERSLSRLHGQDIPEDNPGSWKPAPCDPIRRPQPAISRFLQARPIPRNVNSRNTVDQPARFGIPAGHDLRSATETTLAKSSKAEVRIATANSFRVRVEISSRQRMSFQNITLPSWLVSDGRRPLLNDRARSIR